MKINGTQITARTIEATRKHFVNIHINCIKDAASGKTRVNDIDKYILCEAQSICDLQHGKSDHTLTFVQHALYIQTGKSAAILP